MSKGLFFERWPVVYFFFGGVWGVGGGRQGAGGRFLCLGSQGSSCISAM